MDDLINPVLFHKQLRQLNSIVELWQAFKDSLLYIRFRLFIPLNDRILDLINHAVGAIEETGNI